MQALFTLVGLAVAGGLAAVGFTRGARLRRILATPTTSLSELRPGFREVKGRVAAAEGTQMLVSPLSGTRCVYYEFKVEEHRHHGNKSRWRTVVKDRGQVPCVLSDGTAEVRVKLKEAELVLRPDSRMRTGLFQDAPPELEQTMLERYGRSTQGLIFNKHMRYTETVLEEGDALYALGTVQGTRASGLKMEKGTDLFIVSDLPENELVGRYRWQALALYIAAGVVAVLAAALPALSLPTHRRHR
ncbi:MAG: hypothetical protein HY904_10380 [Deltaproteobacteria bacterium]|nr:hypothetical protein [Deltaproteobacteria bacterium]